MESGLVARDDVLPLVDGQIPAPPYPHQAMIRSPWSLPQGPTSTVATGHKSIVDSLADSPYSIQVSHPLSQSTCTFKWFSRTILKSAWFWRGVVLWGAPGDLPGSRLHVVACLWGVRLTVARVMPTRCAMAPWHMPSRARASTSCLKPIGVSWGIIHKITVNGWKAW